MRYIYFLKIGINIFEPRTPLLAYIFALVADFTFTITVRKGRRIQILHDDLGYLYSNPVADSGDNGALIWKCSKVSCTAQVTIKDDIVTGCQRYHNHSFN